MPLIPNEIEMYLAEDSNPEPRRNKKQLQPSPILILISDRNIFPPRQFSSFSAKLRKIEIPDNGRVLISSWSKKDKLISLCQTRPSRVARFRNKIITSTAIKRTVLKLIWDSGLLVDYGITLQPQFLLINIAWSKFLTNDLFRKCCCCSRIVDICGTKAWKWIWWNRIIINHRWQLDNKEKSFARLGQIILVDCLLGSFTIRRLNKLVRFVSQRAVTQILTSCGWRISKKSR